MESLCLFLLVLAASFLSVNPAINFCSSALCNGKHNIACNNSGAFGPKCPASRRMVNMTLELKRAILHSHNWKRNTLAAGNLASFPSAVRMATMRWNDQLAAMASLNVRRCIFEHDACHNTPSFRYSGQNLAQSWWDSGTPTTRSVILPLLDAFWKEYKVTLMSDINSYPASTSRMIGHFTVMAAERNVAVGCAAVTYRDSANQNSYTLLLACNYATTNIVDRRVYTAGATASKCTTGRNPNYPALCSLNEVIDFNYVNS